MSATEWKDAHGASLLLGRRGAELEEALARSAAVLVLGLVPGMPLLALPEPFAPPTVLRTAEDLGRLMLQPLQSMP